MRIVYTDKAPMPTGHRSQGIVHGENVYVSGQLPNDPVTGKILVKGMAEQTKQALSNVLEILKESGSSMQHVLKTTVFITDLTEWGAVDKAYEEAFGEHKPARSVVQVSELHMRAKIEIEAVAYIPETRPFWH